MCCGSSAESAGMAGRWNGPVATTTLKALTSPFVVVSMKPSFCESRTRAVTSQPSITGAWFVAVYRSSSPAMDTLRKRWSSRGTLSRRARYGPPRNEIGSDTASVARRSHRQSQSPSGSVPSSASRPKVYSDVSDIARLSHPLFAHATRMLLTNDAGEFGARLDRELGKDVSQVTVHRV